jgi:hypothetical protein
MISAAFALAVQLANPGFERGLEGWQVSGHPRIGVEIEGNGSSIVRRAAEGEQYLNMGWRARSATPRDAWRRVFTMVDARRYRGRTIRVSARTKAPGFAHGNGSLIVSAAGIEARTPIAASETWWQHQVTLRVSPHARMIEIAFQVEGAAAELNVDDVRLDLLR